MEKTDDTMAVIRQSQGYTPPPPPPPPPPHLFRFSSRCDVSPRWGWPSSHSRLRRMPHRMELRLHLRGVHRELLDRVEARHKAQLRAGPPSANSGVRLSPEMRHMLLNLPHVTPPAEHQGPHICEIAQVPCKPSNTLACLRWFTGSILASLALSSAHVYACKRTQVLGTLFSHRSKRRHKTRAYAIEVPTKSV